MYGRMGSFGTKVYILGIYIYMKVFSLQLRDQIFVFAYIKLWGWAEMKFFCRYANNEMSSPTSSANIMREHLYATVYVTRTSRFFLSL